MNEVQPQSVPAPPESPPTEAPLDRAALLDRLAQKRRIPASTYRLQLHAGFTFRHAADIVPYLATLGVSHCYCSPYLQARPGSTHGYDICNHNALNLELGSAEDYQAFLEALAAHGLSQLLDFVPNHMGVDPLTNPWWRDVLENGQASPYARFFDIDWAPLKSELQGKVLLPILGDHYGLVLERGELRLELEEGGLVLRYGQNNLPIDPRQYPYVLRHGLEQLQSEIPPDDPQLLELLSILTALDHLPACTELAPEKVAERQREKKVARERLARLLTQTPRLRQYVDEALRACNGQPGQPDSFNLLHELLEKQPYRLAYWRTAFHEINYRRFFDINELAGLRMEEPAVFAATHGLVLRLIKEGRLSGLRLDHLDGLYDPAEYLDRLQEAVLLEYAGDLAGGDEATRDRLREWRHIEMAAEPRGLAARPLNVVVEKILSGNETLPAWPVDGTSGYEFLNEMTRLFVDASKARKMKQTYERFTGRQEPFGEVVYDSKKLITWTAMASELNVLADALNRISERDRKSRDFTLDSLREALRELVACFPVYRTYISRQGASETDRQMLDVALSRAQRRNPAMEHSVFDFLRQVFLPPADLPAEERALRVNFAMKFQQYTGPVQAKGVEDTAFYRYNVLLALNEVGGDPQRFGGPPAQFHEANRRRLETWPATMLATATHDTKRGEDARARLCVLSEMPEEWRRQIFKWSRINARNKTLVNNEPAPDRNDEYLFYQALIAGWPAEPAGTFHNEAPPEFVKRISLYMTKALKEAKVHTSWINPFEPYDQAVTRFVEKSLRGARAGRFLASFLPFQQRIARLGMVNGLAQLMLKVISPGVPDFYQGCELWDLSYVDPDNRRPVDFTLRRAALEQLQPLLEADAEERTRGVAELVENWHDGRIKLLLTAHALRWRRELADLFRTGDYVPLEAQGKRAENVVAILRRRGEHCFLAVVPRLVVSFTHGQHALPVGPDVWETTRLLLPAELRAGAAQDLITGKALTLQEAEGRQALIVAEAFSVCPVSLVQLA